jgi:hypothetical protein
MMIVDRIQLQYGIMYVVLVLEPWRGTKVRVMHNWVSIAEMSYKAVGGVRVIEMRCRVR